VINGMAWAK